MVASIERDLRLPRGSFFLLGPRGTGKSTWVRHALPDATLFDLLDEGRYQTWLADPAAFAAELRALPGRSSVIVDEVQRLPSLLNEVHRAIEGRRLRFALTGSSARRLRRGGTNLLGGRAVELHMSPFLPQELGPHFDLERALREGTLPLVWASDDPEETLAAYVHTYLKQEIQAEALVRNLPGFARFLPVAALFHGQALSVSSLARDAGVSRTTVEGYLQILEDTLVATRLPAYEGRLRVRERRHPKLYFFDPGVARALRHVHGPLQAQERGALVEGLVLGVLGHFAAHHHLCDRIGHWSPAEARLTEVDFVLERGTEVLAIEVKSSVRLHEVDFRGLRSMEGTRGLGRRILVYAGDRRLRTQDGIDAWPVATLADELAGGRL